MSNLCKSFTFAKRVQKVSLSSILLTTAKAKELKFSGKDVINFGAGEPDFETPDFIKDKAIEAIRNGFTKYTPTSGIPELKKLICEKFEKDNFLDYNLDQIVVSCGAKQSLFNALFVLVNPLDEVLIPSPHWISYPEMVNLCEGIPHLIKTNPENNFKITTNDLEKNINSKTKVLILNSPSNPTGCVYTHDELAEIAKICVENKIFVISDEIYEKIIFDGIKHISIAGLNKDIYEFTITVNGLSKSYSMTGWRIGYLGASLDITDAISRLQDHFTSHPTSISQWAAVAALEASGEFLEKTCEEFQKRRDYCISRLGRMKKINYYLPKGAFYIFCDISKVGMDSSTFAQRLLDEAYVSIIPGVGFGFDTYIRLSFATDFEQLEKGMDRIERWLIENI